MGQFSVHLMTKGAILSPVHVNAKKSEVPVPLQLRGELCIPLKAILIVEKPLQLL